ncbi:MAG TPA: DsbA family protein [Ferruginibacter sp.]|nr:DsbA family protein [Ferruginibacter sp.]HMP19985.1 DsbA family protein [Ferruginibacter sp.]
MNLPMLIYCYDAYCGWCYGFSPVISKLAQQYNNRLQFEVLSGGMIVNETPKHISLSAGYIKQAYQRVEETTSIQFGSDYLWHINHPQDSDWYPSSEKPAIALCVFKEYYPEKQVAFAADLQYALHYEGRDLCDDEAYRHLLDAYNIPTDEFYTKLNSPVYKAQAYDEFELCTQLQVRAYPAVLLQVGESKFHLVARGYVPYEVLAQSIDEVLAKM